MEAGGYSTSIGVVLTGWLQHMHRQVRGPNAPNHGCNLRRTMGVCRFAAKLHNQTKDRNMKKLLMALCVTCALALVAHAQEDKKSDEGKKKAATPEQKAAAKALKEKYDTNKDGKLDKDERAKIPAEEREKAGMAKKGKKKKAE
jgi:hypothetical protein